MKKPILSRSNESRRHHLEDAFFSSRDAKLIEQLQLMEKMKESKEALRKVSNIKNEAVLEKLVSLDVRPEMLVPLAMVPLLEIVWADGTVDDEEREAILKAVVDAGFDKSSVNYAVIENWLTHRPPAKLLSVWLHYTQGLCENLSGKEKKDFCKELVDQATAVAESSGGFLGLGNKISKAEQKVIDTLKTAFE